MCNILCYVIPSQINDSLYCQVLWGRVIISTVSKLNESESVCYVQ